MRPRVWAVIPLTMLCLAGALVSKLLLDKHLFKASGPSWFAAACGDAPAAPEGGEDAEAPAAAQPTRHEGARDCGAVLASRWATLPPRSEESSEMLDTRDEAQAPRFSVPVAYVGLVYFLGLAIWLLFIGRPTADRPQWFRLPFCFVLGGALFSTFYLGLMFLGMDEWCPWCLVTHGLNYVILGGFLLLRPEGKGGQLSAVSGQPEASGPTGSAVAAWSHPSDRLVAACVLLAAVSGAAVWHLYAANAVLREKWTLQKSLAKFIGDSSFLTAMYYSKPEAQVSIRADDPQTSTNKAYCSLVVFSDFQCPWCRGFARLVRHRLDKLFQNHLRLVWKHYPLCTECNPNVQNNTHADACKAARGAEAARLQGGNDAFWKMHDRIFEAQQQLGRFDYAAAARELGLNADRLAQDMESEAVKQRLAEDIEQAKRLGVKSTPAIFLLNRPVEPMLAKVMPFWELMAHNFNYDYDEKAYREKTKKLEAEGKLPPTTQDDHAGHGHN